MSVPSFSFFRDSDLGYSSRSAVRQAALRNVRSTEDGTTFSFGPQSRTWSSLAIGRNTALIDPQIYADSDTLPESA